MFTKNLKQNYIHLFFIFSIVILLIGLQYKGDDTTLDINVHDTYYVIAHFHVDVVISIFSFIIWLVYFLLSLSKFKLNKRLITFQFFIYALSIIGIKFPMIFIFDKNNFKPSLFQNSDFLILIFFGLFLISIILFVIIVAKSIFNKLKK